MSKIDERLSELGLQLPNPPAPAANYVPAVSTGNLVFVAGQVCFGADGKIADAQRGKLGDTVSVEQGQEAARVCALNVLAQLKQEIGDLDRVVRCVRLGGFVNSTPNFGPIPQVMNGASDLMVELFGDRGRHARATVGVAQLPLDAAVEVEGIFEIG